jgi:hypothetical protein
VGNEQKNGALVIVIKDLELPSVISRDSALPAENVDKPDSVPES